MDDNNNIIDGGKNGDGGVHDVTTGLFWRYDLEGKAIRTFSDWLLSKLDENDIKVEQLAEVLGESISSDDIWNLIGEKARYAPSHNLTDAICTAFAVSSIKDLNLVRDLTDFATKVAGIGRVIDFDKSQKIKKIIREPVEPTQYLYNLVSARNAFYQFMSKATNGQIASAEDFSEVTGIDINLAQGLRRPRRNEIQNKDLSTINISAEMSGEFLAYSRRFFGTVKPSPPAKEGEKSASQLKQEFVGNSDKINNELKELRKKLIADIVASGIMDEEMAEANVDTFLIGMRKPAAGGPEATYSTEDGQRVWQDAYGATLLEDAAPTAKEGEKSAHQLKQEFVGNNTSIKNELTELRKKLIADIVASGIMDEEMAEANVDAFLIGMRKPAAGGAETTYSTEDGQRVWQNTFNRKRRNEAKKDPAER